MNDSDYRYLRHLDIEGWGREGQKKISESKVFIAGAGGLGTPVAAYLTAAGVGTLIICDHGRIKISNLNRQIFYKESEINRKKVEVLSEKLAYLNSSVKIVPIAESINEDSVVKLLADADIIVDCLDNIKTRMILNNHIIKTSQPLIHAGVSGMSAQVTVIHPPHTPCLQCIYTHLEGTIKEDLSPPVAGPVCSIAGGMQALEVMKIITGTARSLKGKLLFYDGINMDVQIINISRNKECSRCSGS
jgi:adenylyltransferase/sulfurtransferase